MSVNLRQYDVTNDFIVAGDFINKHYQPDNQDGNFLQPGWEYIHGHPYLDEKSLDKFGVWEDSGNIVGIAHYEHKLGEAFFEVHADYISLKPAMLDYAEKNLYGESGDGRRFIRVWVNDFDQDFTELVMSSGYQKDDTPVRPMSQLKISLPFRPDITLPEGFQLKSLAEDNNLEKLDRVLYRGFNHGDEPPSADREARCKERQKQQSVPGYRKDLNIVIVAPDGQFVAYSGTWIVANHKYAYIEPVCTDPDYRRRGLGKAAVLEGVRRCVELGTRVAYVGSDQPFYLSMGFKKIFTCQGWIKYLDID
jgi:ribosomal protein S18 acetylase RimI-like enzyme